MDFSERQEQARQRSARLIPLVLLAVAGVIPAVYLLTVAVVTVFSWVYGFWSSAWIESFSRDFSKWHVNSQLWRPELFAGVTAVTLLIIIWNSARKIRQLSAGGRVVAEMLGGRHISRNTREPGERRLVNVVEEMSLASGNPVPEIYVLRDEPGLNAFVAGHTADDMVVAVTEGCTKYLTREELQGIIAHEYSHLLNGDMAINMRLMGLVHGLFCIALFSYWVMDQTHDSSEPGVQSSGQTPGTLRILRDIVIMIVGFMLAFIGFIGALCGRMVKSAVAREREYLADAAAVQFTRNPDGLASALRKSETWPEGTAIRSSHAEEASHLFFNDGMDEDRGTLTATHPPLHERIARVENMMGRSLTADAKAIEEMKASVAQGAVIDPVRPARTALPPALPGAPAVRVTAPPPAPPVVSPGIPTAEHLSFIARILEKLPAPLTEAARDPAGAWSLICALLLGAGEAVRAEQLKMVQASSGDEVLARMQTLAPHLEALEPAGRIPLVDLSIPALRQLSAAQYEQLMRTVQLLIRADQRIDLFELALHKTLHRRLSPAFKPASEPEITVHALSAMRSDCAVLLSALAHASQSPPEAAEHAFRQGVRHFGNTTLEFKWMPPEDCSVNSIEAALNHVAEAGPRLRKQVVEACVQTVASDGMIQTGEAELLRAIADALDCPIPPFASQAAG